MRCFGLLCVLGVIFSQSTPAQAQSIPPVTNGFTGSANKPVLDFSKQSPVNEQLKNAPWSPFGKPADQQFYTPVGPVGAKANVFDAPSASFLAQQRQLQQQRTPWQRFLALFGLGAAPPPGTVQLPLPPGSVDPKIFGNK